MFRFWQKIRKDTFIKLGLPDFTALKKCFACMVEGSVEERQESGCFLVQNFTRLIVERSKDSDIFKNCIDVRHNGFVLRSVVQWVRSKVVLIPREAVDGSITTAAGLEAG